MKYVGEQDFDHKNPQRTGVLICNLGTPESFKVKDVRSFLKEFLSDGRVIEIPKAIWWFILNGIILRFRPKKISKTIQVGLDRRRISFAGVFTKDS